MAEPLVSCSSEGVKVEKLNEAVTTRVLANLQNFLLKCLLAILSYGPMPKHLAFIMDGNRRYAKSRSIQQGAGHRAGYSALIENLVRCNDMGVKYVTFYAFSIDNFKRDPIEVQSLMELMEEKINELLDNQSVIHRMNCKINFWGNLDLMCEPVRLGAQKLMESTAANTGLSSQSACPITRLLRSSMLLMRSVQKGGKFYRETLLATLMVKLQTMVCIRRFQCLIWTATCIVLVAQNRIS